MHCRHVSAVANESATLCVTAGCRKQRWSNLADNTSDGPHAVAKNSRKIC